MTPADRLRHVVLVGLMGAGKSTVGRELAQQLGWLHVDNDAALAERTGGTPRAVERQVGAERLHALEAEALMAALAAPGPSVISAAASTIEDDRCREALSPPGVFVVWLRASVPILAARARRGRHRPELGAELGDLLHRQVEGRSPRFEAVANLIVDASDGSPARLADRIRAAIDAQTSR